MNIKLSKKDWINIGIKSGWLKQAQEQPAESDSKKDEKPKKPLTEKEKLDRLLGKDRNKKDFKKMTPEEVLRNTKGHPKNPKLMS